MRIFKIKAFQNWANTEGLTDEVLRTAVNEMEDGLIDANLGGDVYKKRMALKGRGKRGGARTLVVYQRGSKTFFVYGFAKKQQDNINDKQLKALKSLAEKLLGYSDNELLQPMNIGELIEVLNNE